MGCPFFPDVEVVTHCWSGEDVPVYHRLLDFQLASIASRQPDGLRVAVTVFCHEDDNRTRGVLAKYEYENKRDDQRIRPHLLPSERLFRRAIGRNIAATKTQAHVVWFTDCDYCFFGDSLRAAFEQMSRSHTNMIHPERYWIHRYHATGDAAIESGVLRFDEECWTERRERRAIGGIQIVRGAYCRTHGYLVDTRWMQPVPDAERFLSCKCDVPFRRAVGGSTAVDVPDVYRVRHSRAGRDGGTKDHGNC